jgi:hypothetical protein
MPVNHFFVVHGFSLLCATWVPMLAVGIEVSHEHRATSDLPHHLLPVLSPCWFLSCLPCSVIINNYNPYEVLSPPVDVENNYVIISVLAQVGSFNCCLTSSISR